MACVNNTNGVILLPDDWSSAVFVLNHTNENNVSFNVNVISLSHWEYLEANGAVFLPAAGLRLAQNDIRHNIGGYWTITHASTFGANVLYFVDKLFDNNVYSERQFGNSVRLVHDY